MTSADPKLFFCRYCLEEDISYANGHSCSKLTTAKEHIFQVYWALAIAAMNFFASGQAFLELSYELDTYGLFFLNCNNWYQEMMLDSFPLL
jgi:hypothetical protein